MNTPSVNDTEPKTQAEEAPLYGAKLATNGLLTISKGYDSTSQGMPALHIERIELPLAQVWSEHKSHADLLAACKAIILSPRAHHLTFGERHMLNLAIENAEGR